MEDSKVICVKKKTIGFGIYISCIMHVDYRSLLEFLFSFYIYLIMPMNYYPLNM